MQSNQINPETWDQIQKQFEQIKQQAGIEPEEEYIKELEDMFGMSLEEMNRETEINFKSKNLGVKLIHPDAVFPSYAYPSDSGFDLYSVSEIRVPALGRALVPTGIKLSIPEGYEIQVRPKSGLAINQGITVLNTPGTVDSGYLGEIKVIVFNTNNESFTIGKGMKIAQAVLCPVMSGTFVNLTSIDEDETKDRGDNGFGSTGINN
jgi:dUTP pyrophosphatase